MESPWKKYCLPNVEMEDGASLNIDNEEHLFLEEILQHFALSSETGSTANNLLNCTNGGSKRVAIDESQPAPETHDDQAGGGRRKRRKAKSSSEHLDHAGAERKRRLELSQGFIALSALIPGLKKIDKVSILKEATTYVKQLLNRVKEMEEQSAKKIIVESVSVLNDAGFHYDQGIVPYNMNSDGRHKLNVAALPEVEARVMEKQVLIRIHCDGNQDILLKTLSHVTSLDLSIVSHTMLPFGKVSLDITIIAQMGDNYKITLKDLVRSLRRVLLEFGVT